MEAINVYLRVIIKMVAILGGCGIAGMALLIGLSVMMVKHQRVLNVFVGTIFGLFFVYLVINVWLDSVWFWLVVGVFGASALCDRLTKKEG